MVGKNSGLFSGKANNLQKLRNVVMKDYVFTIKQESDKETLILNRNPEMF
jgi:hypothetical protein